eukprot:jgi/Chlat1/4267/Chrsp29S08884
MELAETAAPEGLTSVAAAQSAGRTVDQLLADPLLSDLPKNVTLEEVEALIALESGSGMQLTIRKLDGSSFSKLAVAFHLVPAVIVVTQSARLGDIKQAIRRHYERQEQQHMGKRHISWKYVWRKNCLTFDSKRLLQDDERAHDCGVRNNSEGVEVDRTHRCLPSTVDWHLEQGLAT